VILGLVFVAALGRADPGSLVLGVVVVALALWAAGGPAIRPPRRTVALLRGAPVVGAAVGSGVVQAARAALSRHGAPHAGWIELELPAGVDESALATTMHAICLSPGSVALHADPHAQTMVVHVLDVRRRDREQAVVDRLLGLLGEGRR
jgi:multisubunit Na+/H+ antiporter MnhE subunit